MCIVKQSIPTNSADGMPRWLIETRNGTIFTNNKRRCLCGSAQLWYQSFDIVLNRDVIGERKEVYEVGDVVAGRDKVLPRHAKRANQHSHSEENRLSVYPCLYLAFVIKTLFGH